MMNKKFEYLPKEQRKKILLICDDIRVHSGVATVAKEIVLHTSHHFNWVQMAGAIKHPDKGKRIELSKSVDEQLEIKDSSVVLYPQNGYGTPESVRQIIDIEKPDAIMLFTDPRYFIWLFNMENEIRRKIPITYLNIWDDYPAPMYNQPYYEACDLLMGISKQTVNINKLVLGDKGKNKIFKYIPHGLNPDIFFPINPKDPEFKNFKKLIFQNRTPEFVLFFNSRNIRRKQIPDTLLAFRSFLDSLPKEKAKNCFIILHTELITEAGTDLKAVKEYLFNENYKENVIFSSSKLTQPQLNYLYNIADAQILLTSNEGWGLSITEALLSGTPVIANVTGGMQDQMRFEDNKGEWYTPDADIPSNHKKTFDKHGEWAFPVYPSSRSIQGSPMTPYIFDDRCKWEDACDQIKKVYNLSKEERQALGLKGREWAMSEEAGFTIKHQADRVIEAFNGLFSNWKPRDTYEVVNANEYKGKFLNHKIEY